MHTHVTNRSSRASAAALLLLVVGGCRVGQADLEAWLDDGASTRPPTQPEVVLTPSAPTVVTGLQATLSQAAGDPAPTASLPTTPRPHGPASPATCLSATG